MKNADLRKIAIVMISCVLVISVVCLVVMLVVFNLPEDTPLQEVTASVTTAPSTAVLETEQPSPTAAAATENDFTVSGSVPRQTEAASTQAAPAAVPESLQNALANSGYTAETLAEKGVGQLVVVISQGSAARISLYENTGAGWTEDAALNCSGFIGAQGAVTEMSEQVSGTPVGLYSIGEAFYQYNQPVTGLNTFAITEDTYWVDDPDSAYYNRRVIGAENRDWNSAEHMMDIEGYKYGFVIDYNTAAEYNKGSAIFFHIGYTPTQGCVAASEDMVLAYLAKLSADRNPYILVQ